MIALMGNGIRWMPGGVMTPPYKLTVEIYEKDHPIGWSLIFYWFFLR